MDLDNTSTSEANRTHGAPIHSEAFANVLGTAVRGLVTTLVVGFAYWYLANYRSWERERMRLYRFGLPWAAMPDEPEENRRLGLTRIKLRCELVVGEAT